MKIIAKYTGVDEALERSLVPARTGDQFIPCHPIDNMTDDQIEELRAIWVAKEVELPGSREELKARAKEDPAFNQSIHASPMKHVRVLEFEVDEEEAFDFVEKLKDAGLTVVV